MIHRTHYGLTGAESHLWDIEKFPPLWFGQAAPKQRPKLVDR